MALATAIVAAVFLGGIVVADHIASGGSTATERPANASTTVTTVPPTTAQPSPSSVPQQGGDRGNQGHKGKAGGGKKDG